MQPKVTAPKVLNRANWEWTPQGLIVTVQFQSGQTKRVHIPLARVEMIFNQEFAAVGCPFEGGVGDTSYSVGGFFKKIKRGVKKFRRKVGRTKVGRFINRTAKKVTRVAKKVATGVKNVVTHPAFRAGFGALATAFPVLAPAAAGLEIASRVIDKVEKGKAAVDAIKRGVKNPKTLLDARNAKEAIAGVGKMIKSARDGDPRAQQFMGAITQVSAKRATSPKRGSAKRAGASLARAARKAARRGRRNQRRDARRAARRAPAQRFFGGRAPMPMMRRPAPRPQFGGYPSPYPSPPQWGGYRPPMPVRMPQRGPAPFGGRIPFRRA